MPQLCKMAVKLMNKGPISLNKLKDRSQLMAHLAMFSFPNLVIPFFTVLIGVATLTQIKVERIHSVFQLSGWVTWDGEEWCTSSLTVYLFLFSLRMWRPCVCIVVKDQGSFPKCMCVLIHVCARHSVIATNATDVNTHTLSRRHKGQTHTHVQCQTLVLDFTHLGE